MQGQSWIRELSENYIWFVNCRAASIDGGAISALDVYWILEQIMKWMSKVIHWTGIIMLSSDENAFDVRNALANTDGYEDIVM